jgi:hypothetical protein
VPLLLLELDAALLELVAPPLPPRGIVEVVVSMPRS